MTIGFPLSVAVVRLGAGSPRERVAVGFQD
jgi:hypothetical protein